VASGRRGTGRAAAAPGRHPHPEERVDDYRTVLGRHAPARDDRQGSEQPDVLIATSYDARRRHHPGADHRADGRLKDDFNSSVILITHDLGVVRRRDDIAVMYAGRIVEYGSKRQIFYDPLHPYTWACSARSASRPREGEKARVIAGAPPSLINLPQGCKFAALPACVRQCLENPRWRTASATHHASRSLLADRRAEARPARGHDPRRGGRVSTKVARRDDSPEEVLSGPEGPAPARVARVHASTT